MKGINLYIQCKQYMFIISASKAIYAITACSSRHISQIISLPCCVVIIIDICPFIYPATDSCKACNTPYLMPQSAVLATIKSPSIGCSFHCLPPA